METAMGIWKLIGFEVQMELGESNSKNCELTSGHLIAQDPISNTLLLGKISNEMLQALEWIPIHSVKSITIVERLDSGTKADITSIVEHFLERHQCTDSDEIVRERGLKVVNYLRSHHLSISEKPNGVFIIDSTVRFESPYSISSFYCDIPLVLRRVQNLVRDVYKTIL